jgi:hypothetical protein
MNNAKGKLCFSESVYFSFWGDGEVLRSNCGRTFIICCTEQFLRRECLLTRLILILTGFYVIFWTHFPFHPCVLRDPFFLSLSQYPRENKLRAQIVKLAVICILICVCPSCYFVFSRPIYSPQHSPSEIRNLCPSYPYKAKCKIRTWCILVLFMETRWQHEA